MKGPREERVDRKGEGTRKRIAVCLSVTLLLASACTSPGDEGQPVGTGGGAGVPSGDSGGSGVVGDGDLNGSGGEAAGTDPNDPTGQAADPGAGYAKTGISDDAQQYPAYTPIGTERVVSRAKYYDQLQGFWLGQNIANWTGLVTEFDKDGTSATMPFYTDADWGTADLKNIWGFYGPSPTNTIDYVFTEGEAAWGSDDDTDLEYIYLHLLSTHQTSLLSAEQIRDGWLLHIMAEEENFLWVSNQTAYDLMSQQALLPPATSEPENNENWMMIDAQLTTESFGLYAPARPDFALKMAHLPIRTTAKDDAEWISEFYVIMHSLASYVNPSLSVKDRLTWMAEQARGRLPADSFSAAMYDFVKAEYEVNPDKDNWEATRDAVYERYQVGFGDGYIYQEGFDAGINFAASLVSLFYGEGDLARTTQIGSLCGWDSDNPTATWGGLIGFLIGKDAVAAAFGKDNLSQNYNIHRTRQNFPDHNGAAPGQDSFPLMAERMLYIIDRVVQSDLGGGVDLEKDVWYIPDGSASY